MEGTGVVLPFICYNFYALKGRQRILDTYRQMEEIDTLGAFESEDDVGMIFEELKRLVFELEGYVNEKTNLENK